MRDVQVIADRHDPVQWGLVDDAKQLLRDAGYTGKVILDLESEE
jgi:hypothetical protein